MEDNDITREPLLLIDTAGCDLQELDLPDEQSRGNEGENSITINYLDSVVNVVTYCYKLIVWSLPLSMFMYTYR